LTAPVIAFFGPQGGDIHAELRPFFSEGHPGGGRAQQARLTATEIHQAHPGDSRGVAAHLQGQGGTPGLVQHFDTAGNPLIGMGRSLQAQREGKAAMLGAVQYGVEAGPSDRAPGVRILGGTGLEEASLPPTPGFPPESEVSKTDRAARALDARGEIFVMDIRMGGPDQEGEAKKSPGKRLGSHEFSDSLEMDLGVSRTNAIGMPP
jgi:hypothetical protein